MNLEQLTKAFKDVLNEDVYLVEGTFRNASTITGYSLDVSTADEPILSVHLSIYFGGDSYSFDKTIEYIDNESLESAFWPSIDAWNPQNKKEDRKIIFDAFQKIYNEINGITDPESYDSVEDNKK